ncbi:MAG: hypothetical protein V1679_01185, partial [Candidatus Peregrinibacteria bacterium]
MQKTCTKCSSSFHPTEKDQSFYSRLKVPPPQLCHLCREQRRITFRNEKNLYLRHCALCKKQMVSIYSPDKPYHALCAPCFWSDKNDPHETQRAIDFTRPFFEQFDELLKDTYLLTLFSTNCQNAEYVNQETDSKNCYMNAGGHFNEDCYYNMYSIWGKNNVDNYWIIKSELLYECINCEKCFNSTYLQDCQTCSDCHYCKDCQACQNCFGCFGLRHKNYHFFNEKLSPEEYKRKIQTINNPEQKAKEHFLKYPHRPNRVINCENSTGDYLYECKDLEECYLFENSRDIKYGYVGLGVKDSMDVSSFGWGEVNYNVASSIELINCIAVSSTVHLNFSQYCFCCFNSSDIFGCVGLNHKKYCILNKQYDKEEYEVLKKKLIDHMLKTGEYGEFFPPEISPFGYNETVAYEYFQLTKEQVDSLNWKWKDPEKKDYLPPDPENHIYTCSSCSKNYKLIPQELKFYSHQNLPLPLLCPTCRHHARLAKRNPHKNFDRTCAKC